MKIIYKVTLILSVLGLFYCSQPEKKSIAPDWLEGDWQSVRDDKLYESWTKINDSVLTGTLYLSNGEEKKVMETLKVIATADTVYYFAIVPKQNQGQSIVFKALNNSMDSLLFINETHDYPKQIKYVKIGNDTLHASIGGYFQGQWRSAEYLYHRKKVEE